MATRASARPEGSSVTFRPCGSRYVNVGAPKVLEPQPLRDYVVELESIGSSFPRNGPSAPITALRGASAGARGDVIEQDDASVGWACDTHHHVVIRVNRFM